MTSRPPISVFIIALNEADRIGAVIDHVIDWVDEVIVIDSGSTDNTCEIAAQKGARVMFNAWEGFGPQKRFGEAQCRNDWVLNLDADEVICPALKQEILSKFTNDAPYDGYEIQFADCLPGEKVPGRGAYKLVFVRLYNRTRGSYSESTVHDTVSFTIPNPKILRFQTPAWHYSVRSFEHAIFKLNRYSSMQAQDIIQRKRHIRFLPLVLISTFICAFFKAYILRLYIRSGMTGFINAMIYAFSRFIRMAKVYELERSTKSR